MDTYYLVNVVYKSATFFAVLANYLVTSIDLWQYLTSSITLNSVCAFRTERPTSCSSPLLSNLYLIVYSFLLDFGISQDTRGFRKTSTVCIAIGVLVNFGGNGKDYSILCLNYTNLQR